MREGERWGAHGGGVGAPGARRPGRAGPAGLAGLGWAGPNHFADQKPTMSADH
jgi:hypothetical protein